MKILKKACTKLNQLKFNELIFKVRLLENVFAIHFLKILDLIKFEKDKYRPVSVEKKKNFNNHRYRGRKMIFCSAPFKNLYFQSSGKIISCCFNRTFDIGTYPEQSINEIWKGERLARLKDHILHDDLSLGCNICYEQLKAGNYDGVGAINYDKFYLRRNGPTMVEFELENTCNLECIMCTGELSSSIRKNRDKLPPLPKIYNRTFIDEINPILSKLKYAKFLGGEPFLIKIYYDIWEEMIKVNPRCLMDLQTNGTILNEKIIRLLEKGNFKIGVSLDSLNKETFERIRLNADFNVVIKNMDFFAKYNKRNGHPFWISACPMRMNWQEIPDIISFCNKTHAYIFLNTVYHPSDLALWSLHSSELNHIFKTLSSRQITDGGIIAIKNKNHFDSFLTQIQTWYNQALEREALEESYKGLDYKYLENMLVERLHKYIAKIEPTGQNINQITDKYQSLLDQIPSNDIKKRLILTIMNRSIETLFDILNENSLDSLSGMLAQFIASSSLNERTFIFNYDV